MLDQMSNPTHLSGHAVSPLHLNGDDPTRPLEAAGVVGPVPRSRLAKELGLGGEGTAPLVSIKHGWLETCMRERYLIFIHYCIIWTFFRLEEALYILCGYYYMEIGDMPITLVGKQLQYIFKIEIDKAKPLNGKKAVLSNSPGIIPLNGSSKNGFTTCGIIDGCCCCWIGCCCCWIGCCGCVCCRAELAINGGGVAATRLGTTFTGIDLYEKKSMSKGIFDDLLQSKYGLMTCMA